MNPEALLAPIAGASPCGEDMTFSSEFDQIAESRREDDPTLSQGEWVTTLKTADWPGVVAATQNLLTERTKDLRLAMWLTEGLMMSKGLSGLARGLQVCEQLCARFWPDLHPLPDEGDQSQRAGNIAWVLQRMVQLLPTRALTQSRQGPHYTLNDWTQARLHQGQGHDASAPERVTTEQFMRALRDTPRTWLAQTLQDTRQAQATLLSWQALVDQQLGDEGPSFVPAKEALSAVLDELERLARDMGIGTEGQDEPADAADGHPSQPAHPGEPLVSGNQGARGPIQNRAQALQQLREVSSFFRRTEPHSPVAYLADKAVAWAEMPLHEWLRRVVKDQGSMSHLQELLGIEADTPPNSY
jgi:type VI secretion system protein ImpA